MTLAVPVNPASILATRSRCHAAGYSKPEVKQIKRHNSFISIVLLTAALNTRPTKWLKDANLLQTQLLSKLHRPGVLSYMGNTLTIVSRATKIISCF